MTRFQHLAVQSDRGPHTTVVAGIEMAGRSWSTTSSAAAKVRMMRRRSVASVLTVDDCGFTITTGRATVLDVRHPLDGLSDPVAAALAGAALARIGLDYVDQLAGYLDDRGRIPDGWRPSARVLVVVQGTHRLRVEDGRSVEASGAYTTVRPLPEPSRARRRRMDPALVDRLSPEQRSLLAESGPCVVGLQTPVGPVAIPAWWDASVETVAVDRPALLHIGADLAGRCSVTFDHSADVHPSAKLGVMLRGEIALLGDRARGERGPTATRTDTALLGVRTQRTTAWSGFESATRLVS